MAAHKKRSEKDKQMASMMKALGIERTTQRCPQCYRIVACESSKSRYNHKCRG